MSNANQKCQLNGCNRAASTLCYCCDKSVCTRHFTEHIDAVRAQVDPLADAVNSMVEKIRDVTIEQFTEMPFTKLNQWKCDMHRLVDEIFSSKCKEIVDLVEKNKENLREYKTEQWKNVMKIQDEVKQLVEDDDATFQQIESLKNQLAAVEERQTAFRDNFLSIRTQVFGNDLVTISSTLTRSNMVLPSFEHPTRTSLNPSSPPFEPKERSGLPLVGSVSTDNPFVVVYTTDGRPIVKAKQRQQP